MARQNLKTVPKYPRDLELIDGLRPEVIAKVCGVSVRHARRYKLGYPLPEPCRRLLRFNYNGELSALFCGMHGDAWDGFYICRDGSLHVPSFEKSFEPNQIAYMFHGWGFIATLKNQVRELQEKVWAMDKVREAERNGSRMARIQDQALQAVTAALLAEVADGQTVIV